MGFSIEMLNTIRANASEEYQNRIPQATRDNIVAVGNALQTYENLFNEFSQALINKIGKQIIQKKLFKNRLAKFKTGSILTQQDVEEIFSEDPKAEGEYNPAGPNPLGRRDTAKDHVVWHRMNRRDVYAISLGDLDFLRVFRSEAALDQFIAGKLNGVYSAAAKDEWAIMKNLFATYDGYCDYEVPEITEATAATAAKQFVKTVRKATNDLTTGYSTLYNKAHVETWSEKSDLVLFVHKDVIAEIDVEVLAKAFNMGKTDVEVQIEILDDFGSMTDAYALLVDKNWFRVWDTYSTMRKQENAQGLFTNYFYHVHQIVSCSPFQNAVKFKVNKSA